MANRVGDWLVTRWNWPSAAAFAAAFLLTLLPALLAAGLPAVVAWIYVQLPVYMLHQLEEHAGDRFRAFATATVGGGVEVLSRRATFVINSAGVWGIDLLALYLAVFGNPALGLMAIYLPLVNAAGHIVQAAIQRRYNPGLVTAVALFLPVGGGAFVAVSRASGAGGGMQALGLGVAIAMHVAIIVHVKRRLRAAAGGA